MADERYSFDAQSVRRIVEQTLQGERASRNRRPLRAYRSPSGGAGLRLGKIATGETLTYGGSAQVDIWTGDPGSETKSDDTVEAYDWILLTGETIEEDESVILGQANDNWYVVDRLDTGKLKVDATDTLDYLEDQFEDTAEDSFSTSTDVLVTAETTDDPDDTPDGKFIKHFAEMDSVAKWGDSAFAALVKFGGSLEWRAMEEVDIVTEVEVLRASDSLSLQVTKKRAYLLQPPTGGTFDSFPLLTLAETELVSDVTINASSLDKVTKLVWTAGFGPETSSIIAPLTRC